MPFVIRLVTPEMDENIERSHALREFPYSPVCESITLAFTAGAFRFASASAIFLMIAW